ncbi:polysaccharide lyase family 14 protein [Neolentinus lepideus HHB14362 ss-1]|uniref:Polysaccharide lyase family 14 protein n=1 Tax=Neolentinus lepideus HHB14362 ss-1 TaxID=1314782 RepID=A0A165TU99_9AGAM|nr:polysaccharide lyase family 14 protein [Neolentinus lepideus HHB14362 ss-1]
MHHLLPIPPTSIASGFTTSTTLARDIPVLTLVNLSDDALRVHKSSSRLPHPLVSPPKPPPSQEKCDFVAWEAFYPKGSINPSSAVPGGFSFYLSGSQSFSNALGEAKEVVMSYEVLFAEGFEWVKGGKLPGIFGGTGDLAYKCSGGRKDDRCKCFDLRLMWRQSGQGELYAYLPLTPNNTSRLLAVPSSKQNPDYGFSVGRGLFSFPAGQWTTVAERVRLNDVGQENGEVEVYIDGVSMIRVHGLTLRDETAPHVKGMHFQTFFGGSSPEWASTKDQRAWFAGISGAILT